MFYDLLTSAHKLGQSQYMKNILQHHGYLRDIHKYDTDANDKINLLTFIGSIRLICGHPRQSDDGSRRACALNRMAYFHSPSHGTGLRFNDINHVRMHCR